MARDRYHHGNLRAELLRQAEEVLATRGAGELSLRELARLAGVSHAAPRRHFADKQALLDALAAEGFERLGQELDAAVAPDARPFPERLTAFAMAWVRFATERPALLDLMFAAKNRPHAEALRCTAQRAFATSSAMIVAAEADGDVVGEHDRIAVAILATLQGLAALITSGMCGERDPEQLVYATMTTLLDGLRPR
jgi:AcrR family transcriptional regulator